MTCKTKYRWDYEVRMIIFKPGEYDSIDPNQDPVAG